MPPKVLRFEDCDNSARDQPALFQVRDGGDDI